jgi:hypothetical protein
LAAVLLQLSWLKDLPNHDARLGILLVVALLAMYSHHRFAPRLAKLELPIPGEEDRTPLNVEMSRISEEFVDDEVSAPTLEQPSGPSVKWRCSACKEENPERFEICWNCGTAWDN